MGIIVKVDFRKKCRIIENEDKSSAVKPRPNAAAGASKVFQIKISLVESDPEIWRRILVSGKVSLGQLHRIFQVAMGWTDSHLHEFSIDGVSYTDPSTDTGITDAKNERRAKLLRAAPRQGGSFLYRYDFGDNWVHKIAVEKVLDNHLMYTGRPVCIGGRLACPPDDCGGIRGFQELLRILKDPNDPEYRHMREWAGLDFDPLKFDRKILNKRLEMLR